MEEINQKSSEGNELPGVEDTNKKSSEEKALLNIQKKIDDKLNACIEFVNKVIVAVNDKENKNKNFEDELNKELNHINENFLENKLNIKGVMGLIKKLNGDSYLCDSEILASETNKYDLIKALENWCNSKYFKLIYKGLNKNEFKEKCKGIKNTLTICKNIKGHISGIVNTNTWDYEGNQKKDAPGSFMFSLTNYKNEPIKLNVIDNQPLINVDPNYGPAIGCCMLRLLYAHGDFNSYIDSSCMNYNGTIDYKLFTSSDSKDFNITNMEIYMIG